MARNYSIKEAAEIIVAGQDLEAITDLGRRYPIMTAKIAAIGAIAGDKFVEFMGFMPEYITANKVNTVIKNGIVETDAEDTDESDEDEASAEKPAKKATKKAAAKEETDEDESGETDYNKFNGDTLIKMCKERGIYEKGMKKAALVEAMENYDANGGSEESDEVDEDPYAGKSAMELFKLCKSRGIKAAPKKPAKFYADLLTKADQAADEADGDTDDDWDEEEEETPAKKAPAKKADKKKPAAKAAKKDAEDEDDDWDI